MSQKLRFKPQITRVKLNPEQAVLTCACYDNRSVANSGLMEVYDYVCVYSNRGKDYTVPRNSRGNASVS